MAARRRYFKTISTVVTVLLLLSSWTGVIARAGDIVKINMNFKEADIGDVLRTVAEISGVNLVTDGSVTGKITVHLKEISFAAALDLITQTNQLAYRWNGESVVVASPQRIEEIYSKTTTSIINVKYARAEDLKGIISGIYPYLNVQVDKHNNKMVIQGNEDVIEEVIELAGRLDLSPEMVTRSVLVNIDNPDKLQALIKSFYPALKLGEVLINNKLFLQGSSEDVEGALSLISSFNKAPERRFIETLKMKNADPVMVREHLLGFFPDLLIQADQRNKQLLVAGSREELIRAAELIDRLDTAVPRDKVEIVKIDHAEIEGVQSRLKSIYPGLEIEADKPNSQLIITGTEDEIEQAAALITRLDLPLEEEILETVKLKYAEAAALAGKINQLYPQITIQADEASKQIILLGKRNKLDRVTAFIRKMDIAPQEKVVKTIRVHGKPDDIAVLVKGIFDDIQIEVDTANRQLVLFGLEEEVAGTISFIRELDLPRNIITRALQLGNTDPKEVTGQISHISPDLKTRIDGITGELVVSGNQEDVDLAVSLARKIDQENKIVTELVGVNYLAAEEIEPIISGLYPGLKLQLNKSTRELVVTGKEEEVLAGVNFIKKLDTPSRQVIIEARFEEISRTELKNLGLYPDKLSEINFLKDGNGLIDGLSISWPDAIKALEESGQANTLANPRLMALNGEEARLLIGDRIPIVVEDIVDGKIVRKIEYIEAGISLEFKPWITDDNQINLEVNPRVSSIGEPIGSSLPPINTREVQTKIRLQDGETFAIGGLIQDDLIESMSRTPFFSDIPLFGELFKQRRVNDIKTELIIFITPHIVEEKQTEVEDSIKSEGRTNPVSDITAEEVKPEPGDGFQAEDNEIVRTGDDRIARLQDDEALQSGDGRTALLQDKETGQTGGRQISRLRDDEALRSGDDRTALPRDDKILLAGENIKPEDSILLIKEKNRNMIYMSSLRVNEVVEEPEKEPARLPGRILEGEAALQLMVDNNLRW